MITTIKEHNKSEQRIFDETNIKAIKVLVETTPNDMDLGRLVRQLINEENVKK